MHIILIEYLKVCLLILGKAFHEKYFNIFVFKIKDSEDDVPAKRIKAGKRIHWTRRIKY